VSRKKSSSRLLSLLILGVAIRGLLGIFSVQAAGDPAAAFFPLFQGGSTPTTTPTPTLTSIPSLTSTLPPLVGPSPALTSPVDVYAFVQAPVGQVQRPYVILTAFASVATAQIAGIRGFINSDEFVCSEAPCIVYLEGSSRLVFRAFTTNGGISEEVIASVSVAGNTQGFFVTIDSVSQFTTFVDSCSIAWGVRDEENARWDAFVQFPYELNTRKTLHALATQLLLRGVVDASDCPAGGLSVGLDWPTACGLEKASGAMIEWQNRFDGYIWLASKEHGIPPKILKTLIEYETQFWPGNSRFYLDEFGLGQINQLGVDVLLRRDPTVYQEICPGVLSDCSTPYLSLDPSQQALIRGALVSSIDANCPTCEYGLDLDKANDSVALIADLFQANCQQVDIILRTPYKPDEDADAATATAVVATVAAGGQGLRPEYEDYWRFTFLAYHSGISCFQSSLNATRDAGLPVTWENVQNHLTCKSGRDYVNGVFDNLFVFDTYLYRVDEPQRVFVGPTIIPTRTPIPTPTVYISTAVVRVQVYVDRNGNGTPEPGEWIDGMSVLLTTSAGDEINLRTQNGTATFDMNGYRPGLAIDVILPGLYRSEGFILPQQGEVNITFKFDQPALPTILP
jgi:hypothetical protein